MRLRGFGLAGDVTGDGFAVTLGDGHLGEVVLGLAATRSAAWAQAEAGGANLSAAVCSAWDGRWHTVVNGRSARRVRAAS